MTTHMAHPDEPPEFGIDPDTGWPLSFEAWLIRNGQGTRPLEPDPPPE